MKRLLLAAVILLQTAVVWAHPLPETAIKKATKATVGMRPTGGTGFLVQGKEAVYVWTALHTIRPGSEVSCELGEGDKAVTYECESVESWPTYDLAVFKLKNPPKKLEASIKFAKKPPKPGQRVCMGAALTREEAPINLMIGYVSYVDPKPDKPIDEVCLTVINGASGAAMLDDSGDCIGIIRARSGCTYGIIIPTRLIHSLAKEKNILDAFPIADGPK